MNNVLACSIEFYAITLFSYLHLVCISYGEYLFWFFKIDFSCEFVYVSLWVYEHTHEVCGWVPSEATTWYWVYWMWSCKHLWAAWCVGCNLQSFSHDWAVSTPNSLAIPLLTPLFGSWFSTAWLIHFLYRSFCILYGLKTSNIYLFNILCMSIFHKCMYVHNVHAWHQRILKRASGHLEIKLQMAVTTCVLGTKCPSFLRARTCI